MRQQILLGLFLSLSLSIAVQGEDAKPWPFRWVSSVAPGESAIYASSVDGLLLRESSVTSFAASDPTKSETLYTHPVSVWAVVVSPDGMQLASSDYKGNLTTYDLASGQPTFREAPFERWTRALAYGNDSKHLIAGNEAGKIFISNPAGEVIKSAELDGQQIYDIAVSPDGNTIAASDGGGHVHLLKFPGLEVIKKVPCGGDPLWAVSFAQEGKRVIAGGSDRQLRSFAVDSDDEASVIGKTTDWITCIQSNASNDQLAIGTMNGTVYTTDGKSIDMIGKTPSGVWSVVYSGNALFVATRKHMVATFVPSWKLGYVAPDEAKQE